MADQSDYIGKIFRTLSNTPTAGDIDELVEAYTKIGYLAADAEGLAEDATNLRKHMEAEFYLKAKRSAEKVTEREAEANAALEVRPYRDAEVEAATKSRKLRNLLDAIREAINAIKFLGKHA